MSNQDLFNHAFEYNFQAIVEYVNRGGNLNIMNDDGESLFCAFLEGYTNEGDTSPEEQRELESHSDDYINSYCQDMPTVAPKGFVLA